MHNAEKEFFVTATKNIGEWNGWSILAGDHLQINPSITPEHDDLVLVDEKIVSWSGQQGICGVVVYAGRARGTCHG